MHKNIKLLFVALFILIVLASLSYATPSGVSITILGNTTGVTGTGSIINTSGGSITTVNLNGTTQNPRWKAFVGNASGSLTLDNANGDTIFDWSLSTISGEVYATRQSGTINWTGINCAPLNASEVENILLNHSSPDDNVSATFDGVDNQQLAIGTVVITQNTCQTINLYQNSTDPTSTTDAWEEVILYDRGNSSMIRNASDFGNIVYAQNLAVDVSGYENTSTYDFQIIVPENGLDTWASSTAYYFYLELS